MKLRTLTFADEQAAIADINALRGGYQAGGQWTLAQACWHCAWPVSRALHAPPSLVIADEQRSNQAFVDQVISNGWPTDPLTASAEMTPGTQIGAEAIDELVSTLQRMASYPHSHVDTFIFGPLETERFRRFVLIHTAHHMGFFRIGREVKYDSGAAIAADVANLRKGHTACGKWTLAQACWHLKTTLNMLIARGESLIGKPLQPRDPRVDHVIAGGKLPSGIQGPPEVIPPETANDADIDAYLEATKKLDGPLPATNHRLFGGITGDELRKLQFIHSAHHLSHFRPTNG